MQNRQANWVQSATDEEVKSRAGVARVPPMGWSSWNAFYCSVDEEKIRSNVELMESMGLKDLGYEYINIGKLHVSHLSVLSTATLTPSLLLEDDCWNLPQRKANKLQPDPKKFPGKLNYLMHI
jgi:hypothetical protein